MDQNLISNEEFTGKRTEVRGKVLATWRDLTSGEVIEAEATLDGLAGRLQQRYGGARFDRRRGIYRREETST